MPRLSDPDRPDPPTRPGVPDLTRLDDPTRPILRPSHPHPQPSSQNPPSSPDRRHLPTRVAQLVADPRWDQVAFLNREGGRPYAQTFVGWAVTVLGEVTPAVLDDGRVVTVLDHPGRDRDWCAWALLRS